MLTMVTQKEQIRKFFYERHLDFLTSVPQRHIQEIILSCSLRGNSGKMIEWEQLSAGHRTTYGYFLAKGKWDDSQLEKSQKREIFLAVEKESKEKSSPIYVSIDDTVIPKTKPSSKAKRPTEGAGWHYSHLEGKVVYGHQMHAVLASSGGLSLAYSVKRCCPENGTKIDMTKAAIQSLPETSQPVYVLMDSWYTNPGIFAACREKKFHLIGAMKTNRILYPNGVKMSAADYASTLKIDQFHSVTVKGHEFLVHRYEGHLNKIAQAVVLLTYPKGSFGKKQSLRVFLCSDMSLSDTAILEHYTHRWPIEVMFRQWKRYLGFKSYMLRSAKAIDRFLLILGLAHFFFTCGLGILMPFSNGLKACRGTLVIL